MNCHDMPVENKLTAISFKRDRILLPFLAIIHGQDFTNATRSLKGVFFLKFKEFFIRMNILHKVTFKVDFPGNLCREANAILAMFSSKLAITKFVLELSICDELMKSTKDKKRVRGPTLKNKNLGGRNPIPR